MCRACYNISRHNAQGVGHDYRNVNCTFTPRREPQRSQALALRAEALASAGLTSSTGATGASGAAWRSCRLSQKFWDTICEVLSHLPLSATKNIFRHRLSSLCIPILSAANPIVLVLLTRYLFICLHLSRSTPFVPSMCRLSPCASHLMHDVVRWCALRLCLFFPLFFSSRLRMVFSMCAWWFVYVDNVARAIEINCLRFLCLPVSWMQSFAAQPSSVAYVSPPSSFDAPSGASTGPPAVLSSCCGLSEAMLDWLQSGVLHPGKSNKQKGRRVISKRQARRRERRLDVKFGAAFVHSPRGPRRGCTAKFSSNSGELRAIFIGPRPKRAPLSSAAFAASRIRSLAAPRLGADVVVPSPTPMSTVLKLERRFMKRMKHRTTPRPSGCRPRRPNLLPTLNMPRRSKKGNEQRAARPEREHRGARCGPALYDSFDVFLFCCVGVTSDFHHHSHSCTSFWRSSSCSLEHRLFTRCSAEGTNHLSFFSRKTVFLFKEEHP